MFDCLLLVLINEREQSLCEPCQIPRRDLRLIRVGVPPLLIDRAKDLPRMVFIHEGAWAVIDRFSRNRRIVRVHHAMNETDEQPASNELRLSQRDKVQQGDIRTVAMRRLRVMSRDHMLGKQAKPLQVTAGGEEL